MNNDYINIAFSASRQYLQYVPVVIYSLCKNNQNRTIKCHIFHSLDKKIIKIEKRYKKLFQNHKNIEINFHNIDQSNYIDLPINKGWSLELWARWKVLDILAPIEERVLILGVDTMINKDIYEFYSQDLSDYYFAACPDNFISNTNLKNWEGKNFLKKYNVLQKNYINADVVLVNLSETYNKISFQDFILKYFTINAPCLDQDVINFCYKEKLKLCDYKKFNFFPNTNCLDREESLKLYKNASIVQFTGSINKPWNIFKVHWKNFIGVEEWWQLAQELGISYNELVLDRIVRKLKRNFPKFGIF